MRGRIGGWRVRKLRGGIASCEYCRKLPGVSLAQLLSLLALAPARWALLRSASSWPQSSIADVQAFLDRSRDSRVTLFRAAYDAFHQLIFAAWYGSPSAWAAIGYAGPPQV